jgi:hypothetical protein
MMSMKNRARTKVELRARCHSFEDAQWLLIQRREKDTTGNARMVVHLCYYISCVIV